MNKYIITPDDSIDLHGYTVYTFVSLPAEARMARMDRC